MADQKINVKCGFFDAVNKDRVYSAEDMNRPYKRLISNGVFATPSGTPSTDLQVLSASSNMNIIVKKGQGIFGDKWFENELDRTIIVPSNANINPRRDSVIVQVDKTSSGRTGNIVYREGTPSSSPLPPAIGTVENVIEYRIANIYVAPGATYIGQDAIVDLRGSSECPWITSLIQQVDTSTLYNQYRAAYDAYYARETELFNSFMDNLTQQLSVDTNVISYESNYTSTGTVTNIPINIAAYNKNKDVLLVYINHLRATPGVDYTISSDGKSINLTKSILTNQSVNFTVLQSVIVNSETQTLIESVQAISTELTTLSTAVGNLNSDSGWVTFTLENGVTSYDTNTTPAIRKFGNRVNVRGAVKGIDAINTAICTLPTNMRPVQDHIFTSTAVKDGVISATVTLKVQASGTIVILAKSGTIPSDALLSISTNFILN